LRFVPHAVEQLDAADAWWRENREKSPNLLVAEFAAAIDLLRESPNLGSDYANESLEGARRYLLQRTRFHIYYVVRDDTLVVAALWSAIGDHGPPLEEGPL
jgi:plasmid stabilization system protein ParE